MDLGLAAPILNTSATIGNHVGRVRQTQPMKDGWLQAPDRREVRSYFRDIESN